MEKSGYPVSSFEFLWATCSILVLSKKISFGPLATILILILSKKIGF